MSTEWSNQAGLSFQAFSANGRAPTLGQGESSRLLPGACTALPPQAPASLWLCPPSKPPVRLFHHCLQIQTDHILQDSKPAHTVPKTCLRFLDVASACWTSLGFRGISPKESFLIPTKPNQEPHHLQGQSS